MGSFAGRSALIWKLAGATFRRMVLTRRRIVIWAGLVTILAGIVTGTILMVRSRQRVRRPTVVRGAVIKQSSDTKNQSPVADVEVTEANGLALHPAKTDFAGSFVLPLRPDVVDGQLVTLTFRHPDYQPVDLNGPLNDKLYVIRMVPLHGEIEAQLNQAEVAVGNVMIRYYTQSTTTEIIGTGVKTFQVPNIGNVPCNNRRPCSPDGKWKADVASAELHAGEGNEFRNARITCIAGPCPFTRIDSDGFSRGGQDIRVTVRNWSDTTTFLFQAEVFRSRVGDITRAAYPVIFGRAMNFTLPPTAGGASIEAEMNGNRIVFPLGPKPVLSWAVCNVRDERNKSKDYRCELKAGYQFRSDGGKAGAN